MTRRREWRQIRAKASKGAAWEDERAAASRAIDQAFALSDLRAARGTTQVELADAMGVQQSGISRIEHQSDVYISTLRAYIEALGGQLEIRAIFRDRAVSLDVGSAP